MPPTNLVRTSRDGDQFHYLWAARRCLQLLSANSDLVAISIEGPSPLEHADDDPAFAGSEVIDIAEYFGAEDLTSARLVRYMQLKHSTQHATQPWTASGLEKTIKGFATRYQELSQLFPAELLASKLQFWFVTNRPAPADFTEAVADAAAGTSSRHPKELQKLERFTGLEGEALAAFSKLLHFEDRQDGYWDQRNILLQDVGGYLPDLDVDGPLKLKELVTRRALSEGEMNPTITKMDVLRVLGTDEDRLFPAPCLIRALEKEVPRAQEPSVLSIIVGTAAPIVVHASAGVGKTVFATRIVRGLPNGSTCVVYDCFGNGQYRNASGYRHRHKDALVQITNELAAKGLCHLLIPTSQADASSYMRAFVHRMGQAATLLKHSEPHALLCVVVDAADNAQMAAEEIGDARSFVRDLIREKMPDNVRLVFLCRSHRQAHLDPPTDSIPLELKPFSRDETAAYLQQRFQGSSDHDIDEFHRLSSRNPRVQALALSRNDTLPDTLRLLGPNPTTVEDTIGDLLQQAILKLKDSVGPVEKGHIDRICAGLAALRPLIPIPILSKISGVDEDAIRSFAVDLGRPLLVTGNTIQFLDEPAETWFQDKFKPAAAAMAEFIESLTPLAITSAYVASVLPQLMLEAGKLSELVELALASTALPETSPLEKRDVELRRLQFALKAALRARRYIDASKLALKAGGETAGDDRQRRLLQANTDLAAIFLETGLVQELVSRRTFGSGWLGSHHAYEAALLSGCPELVGDARSRLRMANEWLRNWSRLTSEDRNKEEISDQDIVELTLAHINIHGPADGAYSLISWRPREVSFRVAGSVAKRLIDHGRLQDLEEFARAAGNNLCLLLAVNAELREVQRVLPIDLTRRAFRLIANPRIKLERAHAWSDRESTLLAVTTLVEASIQHTLCPAAAAAGVLSRYLPSEPPRALSSRYTTSRFPMLRAYCLRAALQNEVLELRDLAHPQLRAEMDKKNQHSRSRDRLEFEEDIGALLPWHQLWAATLLGRVTKKSLADEIEGARSLSNVAERINYREDFHTSDEIALLWFDILHKGDAADDTNLIQFLGWKDGLKRPLFTPTLTALARLCAQAGKSEAALGFALEAFKLTKDERSDAENKSEGYINAARAILVVSKADAKAFFNEAVEVASRIGDENLSRWDAILDVAARASRLDRPTPEMAYQFARCAELTYAYVDRDKHFDWDATIQALCGLCPSSALAILSRWRDRNFGRSERILPIATEQLIELSILNARDALPLIGFRAQWSYDSLLDRALSTCATLSEKEGVASYLWRYMRFTGGDFASLKNVASRHKVVIARLDEFINSQEIHKGAISEPDDGMLETPAIPTRNWDEVFANLDLTAANDLSRSYTTFKGAEDSFRQDQFFKEAIQRLLVGSEPAFIEAIGNVPEFNLYHFRTFLEQVPVVWKHRPAARRALETTLKAFCRRYCMSIVKNRHYEPLPIKMACELAGISESAIVDVVLDAVGNKSDPADSGRLFSLVGLLAIKLSEDEALEALRFGLDLFTPVLEEKDGDGPWSVQLLPPNDVRASLAGYIWASMAAPDAALRWEGAHAVLGLVTLGRDGVLGHLMQLATEKKGRPFVDAALPFYLLHALQWFMIGIARAANEYPAALTPWVDQILDWALKDQPHILIRQFAARAALSLINNDVLADREHLKERLGRINVTSLPVVESESYDRTRPELSDASTADDDDRFYFGMDVGAYWYAPLGRVFGLSQAEIESEALKVIRNDFGTADKGRWDEDERSRRKLYEEGYTRHSHGSHPRADTLHFYHAYHAMMVVAGKLLNSTPTHQDSDYGAEDEFADWLGRHELSRADGRWLWDRRDPTPLERSAWRDRKESNRRPFVTKNDFEEALRRGGMLNVWGDWTEADSRRQQSVSISSALVSPDKSLALLRALSTAKSFHTYAIPSAGSDAEISKPGVSLTGWILDHRRDSRLDDQDRWAGGISFPPPKPALEVINLMRLETDVDDRHWRSNEATVFMASQTWGHYDEAKRHESSNPECGNRLQASLSFLTAMLAKLGRDLIIEVQIGRRRRYRPYENSIENDKENVPTKAKLFLLGEDGQFRTL